VVEHWSIGVLEFAGFRQRRYADTPIRRPADRVPYAFLGR
jgi:hypothetical protein